MNIDLANTIKEALKIISTIAKSIEEAQNTVERINDKRRIRKISDALSKFYFTPIGIKMNIEDYINNPSNENLISIENKLLDNEEIKINFEEVMYNNLNHKVFNLPLKKIEHIFDQKSKLYQSIRKSQKILKNLTNKQRKEYIKKVNKLFNKFNQNLEITIKSINQANK